MSLPEATLTIQDGQLGIVPPNPDNVAAKVGCCSSGTANTVYQFADSDTLRSTLGTGPLVEAAAHLLNIAGGTVFCVKSPSSTAGAAGSVTKTGTGTATLGTPAGGALDAYSLIVKIVQGGASLVAVTATFVYSLDGGVTWSDEIAIPTGGVYALPNTGLTLTWTYTSGTAFVAGDKWTSTVTGPASSLSEIMAACDALLADANEQFNVHILGIPADTTALTALISALDTKLEGAATNLFKYLYGTVESPSDTDTNLRAAVASSSSKRVEVAAGYTALTSVINGAAYNRPAGWSSTARAAAIIPPEDPSYLERGNIPGLVSIARDEFKTPGLDAARFTTLRTVVGKRGFYLSNARLMCPVGSDFDLVPLRRVMDIGCRAVRRGQLKFLNATVRVQDANQGADAGKLLEPDARQIEKVITRFMEDALTAKGWASAVSAIVDRTVNILSTRTLVVKYSITPLGYIKAITGTIGFKNPFLSLT